MTALEGREAIRANLKAFIDTGFRTLHHVTEYWDAGFLKVFRGAVDMTPDDRSGATVRPTMTHFFREREERPWFESRTLGENPAQLRQSLLHMNAIAARYPEITIVPSHDPRGYASIPERSRSAAR